MEENQGVEGLGSMGVGVGGTHCPVSFISVPSISGLFSAFLKEKVRRPQPWWDGEKMEATPVLNWEKPLMPEQSVIQCLGGHWGPYPVPTWNLKRKEVSSML